MIIDAHAYITPGMHGRTRTGPTRSLPYGRVKHGEQTVQLLPPFSADKTALEPETMLRLMDWAGIDKAVLMQGPFFGDQNTFLHQAARKWPDRFTAAAFLDPVDRQARDTFRRVIEEQGFRCLAFDLSETTGLAGLHAGLRINSEEVAWYWEQAERFELVLAVNLGRVGMDAYQTAALLELIERFPGAKTVIAHLAHPPLTEPESDDRITQWEEQVLLGRHANVWLDTSGLPALGIEDFPFPTALQFIRRAVELVGAEKLMWGSDVPWQFCHATYHQLLNMVAIHGGFAAGQLAMILGETAKTVYGTT
jgi:predicted TIM-barrel fold metal-dependent hydrolase